LKWPADLDEARTWQWTIQGHEITWTRPVHATLRLSFAVNADFTGEAKSYDNKIELTVLDGPEQGQKCPGIFYWMKGQDTRWICFRDPGTGGERPSIMGFNGYDRQTLLALRPGKPRSATEAPAKPVPPQEENPLLKDGLQVFQGTWKFDGCESVLWYTPLEEIRASWQWAIEGHEIVWSRAGKDPVRMRFSIDAAKQPNQINVTFLDGPHAGKSSQGMYRFERTTLWICLTEPGANVPRPEKLAMSSDSQTALILLHQVPKQRVALPDQPAEVPAAPAPPAAAPRGLSFMQGAFHVESWTSEHWPARENEFQQSHWTIQGREVTWTRPGHAPVHLSLTADANKPLPELDLTFLDGPDKGRTCRGVYMDSRHEVELCFADPGAEVDRPTNLGAKPGSRHTALTLVPDRIRPVAEELAAFRGEWKFDIYYSDWWPARISNPPFNKDAWRWTVKENEIAWTGMHIDDVHLSFQLDPSKSPRQIELTFLNGPWKGTTVHGIYKFGFGGRCDICFADPNSKAPRPKHFGYSTNTGQTWLSLERVDGK
jgi:uncharacterized protein (TIGR03067 family)